MTSRFERTRYGLPYLIFIWVFGLVSWAFASQLAWIGVKSLSGFTTEKSVSAIFFLLLLMLCVFARYRPSRSIALSSEDTLNLCAILIFEPEVAVVVMSTAAVLNTISQLADRTFREQENGPWFAYLGEVFFQGGLVAFITISGSMFFGTLNGGIWQPLKTLEFRSTMSIPFVYAIIILIRFNILFVHSWCRGIPLVEITRGVRQLRSFVVFLTEFSNVLLGVVMATVYYYDKFVFLLLGIILFTIVALLSKQARITDELQSTIVELKILSSVGRALSNAAQTRKELLKALYTQGKELFGADSFAIYLYPENTSPTIPKQLQLEGSEYLTLPKLTRRQTDLSSSGAWPKLDSSASSGAWPRYQDEPSSDIPEENAIGLAEWCLNKARSLRVDDASREAAVYGYSWLTRQMPYRSWMGVPLETNHRPLGVISVASLSRAAFTEQHQELLRTLGHQVASALENARLFELATIDGLTGLLTPRFLRQKLAEAFEKARRAQKPLGLIMVDIDHFKRVNDTYGHEVGNEVLRHLAKLVRGKLRDSDIAARYGGEEFTILLPNTPATGTHEVAERLRSAIEKTPVPTAAGILNITASLGVATYPDIQAADQDALLTCADKALYKSKQGGRNRVTEATVGME